MTEKRGIAVKPLEWLPTTINGQHLRDTARDMDGRLLYEAGVVPGQHYCLIQFPKGGGLKSIPCDSVEEAKAVAQADYERRILSALTPAPEPATEQPSVKEAARVDVEAVVRLAHSMTGDWDHIEVHSFETALRSLARGES
ncbi:hypothetical protein [Ruegeria sp. HKCCA4812]|uniref:hypothetical protein n=1 Tax=Ruegeria sp. HKCCA4812 TaxID=2682993 RepID=UPI0014886445|nr:hypothetical protein [Ruegeria sp. HKCCA4812]